MTVCRGCKTEFTSKRNGQQYHSRECFLNSTLKLMVCANCGTKFKKMFSKQVCCSKKCSYLYRAKKMTKGIMVHCSLSSCNKEIYRMPSRIKKYNFCCSDHRVIYQKSPENKDFGKNWKHTPEEIEKIRQASLNRNYDDILTDESRKKMAEAARNKVWTDKAKRNASLSHVGKKLPLEQIEKIKAHAKYGWKNKEWKGSYSSYAAKHIWAKKYVKKLKVCIDKETSDQLCLGRFELSNVDHKYYKRIKDWDWRCKHHHDIYDIQLRAAHQKNPPATL